MITASISLCKMRRQPGGPSMQCKDHRNVHALALVDDAPVGLEADPSASGIRNDSDQLLARHELLLLRDVQRVCARVVDPTRSSPSSVHELQPR
eukprot:2504483-Rhodomonas_salina.4